MPDSDFRKAVEGLRAMRPTYTDPRIKVTGYLNPDGTMNADPTTDAISGNLWVHGYPRGANVQVLIGPNINPHVPGVRVYVGQNEAKQAVAYGVVVDKLAVQQFGPGLTTIAPPVNVPAMGLIEGRLQASELGGLYAHVNGFYYDDDFFPGGAWSGGSFDSTTYDFDLSGDVPGTDGNSVWVRVYFDPADASFHHIAGTSVYTGNNVWLLDETTVTDIAIPAGTYPVGAVGLTFGQTTLSGAYFASARLILSPVGDVDEEWIIHRDVTIPSGANACVPNGVRVTASGSLTTLGSLFII